MQYLLTCACGWETEGAEDEIVAEAQTHGKELHNMEVSHEEALAMATAKQDPPT